MMSKCLPGFDCFNMCRGAMKISSSVILMSDNCTKWSVWHLCADNNRNNMQSLQDNWSKVTSVELSKYFRTVSTDQAVVYLGKAGRSRKTPFINLVTSSYLLISILLQILRKVLIADHAMPRDLYCKPLVYSSERNFNTLLMLGRRGLIVCPQNENHLLM